MLLIAASCGGGGGGEEPIAAPAAVASPTPATEGQFQIAYVDDDQGDIWVVPADGVGTTQISP
ncbi:MAG TPA: hypothetical protein VJ578_00960, partial [Dehalococcoidia bacterium]|nr:hypothetical protein [Dehalococcoidia bacterium]